MAERTRILLLQRMIYYPTLGGANKANRLLLEEFSKKGYVCRVVAPAMGSHGPQTLGDFLEAIETHGVHRDNSNPNACRFHLNGVEVHAILSSGRVHVHALEQIREFNPDWIFVASEDPGQLLLEMAVGSAPERTISIVHTPQQLPFGPHQFVADTAGTEWVEKTAGILTVSHFVKDYIRCWTGREAAVIPFPVYGSGPFKDFACFEEGAVTLINPCAYKGISIFLDLIERFPNTVFAAVPAWGTTTKERKLLEQHANVQIWETSENIDAILSRTRVLLVPSLWAEAFGLVVIEAMLRGIPVLASNVGGLPEAKLGVDYLLPVNPIRQYEPRFNDREYPVAIIPEQNIVPWETALREMLTDRTRYHQVSRQSRRAAEDFVSGAGLAPFEEFLNRTREKAANLRLSVAHSEGNSAAPDPLKSVSDRTSRLSPKQRALLQLHAIRLNKTSTNGSSGTIPPGTGQ